MPSAPKISEAKLNHALNAWATLRPDKSFGGMTLDEFRDKLKASFDLRATIAQLNAQLTGAQNQRDDADTESLRWLGIVVNAIKGDPTEGEDGELYEAFGYIRKSERRSGLSRRRAAAAAPPAPVG